MKALMIFIATTMLAFGLDKPHEYRIEKNVMHGSAVYCWNDYVFIKSTGYSGSVIQVFKSENGSSVPMRCSDVVVRTK